MSKPQASRAAPAEPHSARDPRPWQPAAVPSIDAFEAAQRSLWETGDPVPIIAWEAAQLRAWAELDLLVLLQPDLGARLSAVPGKVTARRVAEEARQIFTDRGRGAWAPAPASDPSLPAHVRTDSPPKFPPEWHAVAAAISRLEAVAEIPSAAKLRKAAKADLLGVLSGVLWALSGAPGADDVLRLERRRAGERKAGAARRADHKGKPPTLTLRALAEAVRAADALRRAFPARYRGAEAVAEAVLQSWAGSTDPELARAAGLKPKYLAQRIAREVNSRKA